MAVTRIYCSPTNQLRNCKPTVDEILAGNSMYGPLTPILQGKMVQQRPEYGEYVQRVPILSPILQHHLTESISLDFFFVEVRPYLLIHSRAYQFLGLYCSKGRGKIETSTAVKHYLNLFGTRGIAITSIHGDNEFEMIQDSVQPIHVEIAAQVEHVGNIKIILGL